MWIPLLESLYCCICVTASGSGGANSKKSVFGMHDVHNALYILYHLDEGKTGIIRYQPIIAVK